MRANNSESTIRLTITKAGYRLQKAPARHWTRAEYGPGYEVIDDRNTLVLGGWHRPYDATLDDVKAFATQL